MRSIQLIGVISRKLLAQSSGEGGKSLSLMRPIWRKRSIEKSAFRGHYAAELPGRAQNQPGDLASLAARRPGRLRRRSHQ
jgi:hypothetical protein